MARDNYSGCIAFVLKWEGGYVDHPRDPGGATNRGITIHTLRRWRGRPVTKADVRNLSLSETHAIYRKNYWDAVAGDSLPAGVDLAVFDYGVNSGPARGKRAYAQARGAMVRPQDLVRRICASRLSFVRGLRTWSTFGRGWARRIAQCEALGVSMALAAAGRARPDRARDLRQEADQADASAAIKKGQAKAAGGGAAAGAGGTGVAAPSTDWEVIIAVGLFVVLVALVGLAIWRSAQADEARAEAYGDIANAEDADADPISWLNVEQLR